MRGIERARRLGEGAAGARSIRADVTASVGSTDNDAHGRSPSDAAGVAVEVARVLRGFRFYAPEDARREELLDRGFRCVRAELDRNGPLELEWTEGGLRWHGTALPLAGGSVDDLVQALAGEGRRRLCLDGGLDEAGFARLIDALAPPEAHAGSPGPTREAPEASQAGAACAAPDVALTLWELVSCRDDAVYASLAERARVAADAAFDAGDDDGGHEILLTLGTHASDLRRSARQREAAAAQLRTLAAGERLGALVDRACAEDPAASIRASQLLLQLGAEIVPTLLREVMRARDANRRGQLTGILIAMGEPAAPEIVRALESGDERQERLAAQLAGDLQHPASVAALRRLLAREDPELRREVAKALAKIRHPSAIDALVAALASRTTGVAAIAAFCLGVTSSARACAGLGDALRGAIERGDFALAREIVRALGRIGRADCVAQLATVLERRAFLQRKTLRELKGIVVETLAKLPGEDALKALGDAVASREDCVAEIARRALARKSGATI